MPKDKKMTGEQRRTIIVQKLQQQAEPITGSALAKMMNVSRQVIVSDVTLLKAKNEPIIATSQGYLYMTSPIAKKAVRTIVCRHTPDRTETEMTIIVEEGGFIRSVSIEHPVYGDLTASIMVGSISDLKSFLAKVKETEASFLSELTDGVHLHVIEAADEDTLNRIETKLTDAGILLHD